MKYKNHHLALTLGVALLAASTTSMADTKVETAEQKFSYAIGFQIGQSVKQQGVNVDIDVLQQAISDVLKDAKLKMSMDEMKAAVESFQKQEMAKRTAKGEGAKKAGEDFLAANKKNKGVITLESGLQYQVLTEGKGAKPTAANSVVAHYEGKLIDGTVFDSSYKRGAPATFGVTGVIKGWQEILPMMPKGAKWKVFIPSELAYGTRGAGASIGPNETLIFDIELIDIK